MDISVLGSGYVGTTIAACFADLGHDETAIDIDEGVVTAINDGEAPIHEPGLDDLVATHAGGNLTATTDYAAVPGTDVTFMALTTPSKADGSIDTAIIESAAEMLGEAIAGKDESHQVVVKSTVVPGTTVLLTTTWWGSSFPAMASPSIVAALSTAAVSIEPSAFEGVCRAMNVTSVSGTAA